MSHVIQNIAAGSFAWKCFWNFVKSLGSHVRQVLFNLLFLHWSRICLCPCQLLKFNTFLHFSHDVQVAPIVYKGILRCVQGFSLKAHSHVTFAQFGVHFLPVQMLLVHNSFHSLRQNSEFQRQVFHSGAFQIVTVNKFLGEWRHAAVESGVHVVPLLDHGFLSFPLIIQIC